MTFDRPKFDTLPNPELRKNAAWRAAQARGEAAQRLGQAGLLKPHEVALAIKEIADDMIHIASQDGAMWASLRKSGEIEALQKVSALGDDDGESFAVQDQRKIDARKKVETYMRLAGGEITSEQCQEQLHVIDNPHLELAETGGVIDEQPEPEPPEPDESMRPPAGYSSTEEYIERRRKEEAEARSPRPGIGFNASS
jgi:hypothetical protein